MADETIIFEQMLGKPNYDDAIFVRLSTSADIGMFMFRVGGIVVKEGLSLGSPVAIIDFIDATGDLVNHNRLDTNATYNLHIGKSPEHTKVVSLKISRIDFENHIGGKTEQVNFRVHFVHATWEAMMHKSHNRGWNNTKLSSVVNSIVSDINFRDKYVSPTRTVHEFVVQPNWTNQTFLKWLAERSDTNSQYDGHFEFGITMDGTFFYGSIPDLVDRFKSMKNVIPSIKMGGYYGSNDRRKEATKANEYVPINFTKLGCTEDFFEMTLQGAGGVRTRYYDFERGEFVVRDNKYGDSRSSQLSDWSLIHPENELAGLNIAYGRDTLSENNSNNRVSSATMSMQRMKVEINGTPFVSIGDIIEVIIPTPVDSSKIPYSEMYSGYYMVSEVEHLITTRTQSTNYTTALTLSRQGIDGKSIKGLVKSKVGKVQFNDS